MASATERLLSDAVQPDVVSSALRKLDRRVLLLSAGVAFISYMDRGNLGFVARDLCNFLDLNHKEYGLAVSLFYAGYITIQFISNELLQQFGGPVWMAFIMFCWGCVSVAMSFMQNTTQFYILRLLLGVAEGGTFPAIFYFISIFYPVSHQTGAYGVIIGSIALAMPISSLLSAGLLSLDGTLGIDGWRYVFIGEGLIPIVYAFVLYFFLPKTPEHASFLDINEKQWLVQEQSSQLPDPQASRWMLMKQAAHNKSWWLLSLASLLTTGVFSVLMFWIALLIHDTLYGDDDEESKTCGSKNGNATAALLLTAIPYAFSCFTCFGLHWYNRKVGIRNRPKVAGSILCIVAVLLVSWIGTKAVSFVTGFLSLVLGIGLQNVGGACNHALIASQFDSLTRCTCIAITNIITSFGPLVLPLIVGALVDAHGYGLAVVFLGSLIGMAAMMSALATDPLMKQNEQLRAARVMEL